jgi:hypothetical protein
LFPSHDQWRRKAIGIELKESYFKQAIKNLNDIKSAIDEKNQAGLF